MSTVNYTEFGLAPWIDFQKTGEDFRADEPIFFDVIFEADRGRIVLQYDLPETPDQDYIAIHCNSTVMIRLKSEQIWLSKEFEGVTTKEPLSSFYGGLVYGDYDEKHDRYKSVSFKARFNQGGKFGTRHRFNINVDLLQYTSEGEPKWIGLSIDPDIKNPPPQGGG